VAVLNRLRTLRLCGSVPGFAFLLTHWLFVRRAKGSRREKAHKV
jgi:hypothetical protein